MPGGAVPTVSQWLHSGYDAPSLLWGGNDQECLGHHRGSGFVRERPVTSKQATHREVRKRSDGSLTSH